eukprot:TRINITY_DN14999_c0_g1_i3.p1 TRINITY_DN14999_c0_g1~~TRINITY_DN14999_c0_g1_i3.p1  ORF type:complete len:483 (+),score=88.25 TRINITY_DN14999_c0_g1_i3:70-1449(+)
MVHEEKLSFGEADSDIDVSPGKVKSVLSASTMDSCLMEQASLECTESDVASTCARSIRSGLLADDNKQCEDHVNFEHTARRILQSIGRGYCTPDPAFSWESTALSPKQGQTHKLPKLGRGWQTPDPTFSPQSSFNPSSFLASVNKTLELFLDDGRRSFDTSCIEAAFDHVLDPSKEVSDADIESVIDRCISTTSVATSSLQWQDPGETVIVLDWDDTILPTTWLCLQAGFRAWKKDLPIHTAEAPKLLPPEAEELRMLDNAARSFLLTAASLGRVCCVTLSQRPWQETTMKAMLPRTAEVWNDLNIPVFYASEENTKMRESSLSMAKSCMQDEEEQRDLREQKLIQQKKRALRRCIAERCKQSWKNVVSIGDGQAELMAMQDLSFEHVNPVSRATGQPKPLRMKTVQLLELPECSALATELQLLQAWLPGIVCMDGDEMIEMPETEDEIMSMHDRFTSC